MKLYGWILIASSLTCLTSYSALDNIKNKATQDVQQALDLQIENVRQGLEWTQKLPVVGMSNQQIQEQALKFIKNNQTWAFVNSHGKLNSPQMIIRQTLNSMKTQQQKTVYCQSAAAAIVSIASGIMGSQDVTWATKGWLTGMAVKNCDYVINTIYNEFIVQSFAKFFITTSMVDKLEGQQSIQWKSIKLAQNLMQSPQSHLFKQYMRRCILQMPKDELQNLRVQGIEPSNDMIDDLAHVFNGFKTFAQQFTGYTGKSDYNGVCFDLKQVINRYQQIRKNSSAIGATKAVQFRQAMNQVYGTYIRLTNLPPQQKKQWQKRLHNMIHNPQNVFVPPSKQKLAKQWDKLVKQKQRKTKKFDQETKNMSAPQKQAYKFMTQNFESPFSAIRKWISATMYSVAFAIMTSAIAAFLVTVIGGSFYFLYQVGKFAVQKTAEAGKALASKVKGVFQKVARDPNDSQNQGPSDVEEKLEQVEPIKPYTYKFGDFSKYATRMEVVYKKKKDRIQKVIRQALQSHLRKLKLIMKSEAFLVEQSRKNFKKLQDLIGTQSPSEFKQAFTDPVNYYLQFLWEKKKGLGFHKLLGEFTSFLCCASQYFYIDGKILARKQLAYENFIKQQENIFVPLKGTDNVYIKSSTQEIFYNVGGAFYKAAEAVQLSQQQRQYILKFVTAFCIEKKFIVSESELRNKMANVINVVNSKYNQKLQKIKQEAASNP